MRQWFYKSNIPCFESAKQHVDSFIDQTQDDKWIYDPRQCPGSRSIEIPVPQTLHEKIQQQAKVLLYNQWYIWDYMSAKDLLIHKDTNEPGNGRAMAYIINLEGEFENKIYTDDDHTTPLDTVLYGPGESLYLNNSMYYHGGKVLTETRKTLSCWIDVYDKGLEDVLA